MFTERQRQIINSAIELIAQEGIQKLTIKNLSAKVGVTEGAIYRHFNSKLEILLGILELFKENTYALPQKILREETSAVKQLSFLFDQRFKQFMNRPALASIIFAEEIFQNDRRLSDAIFAIMKASQEIIKEIIEQGQKNNEIRGDISSEQLSLILLGSLRLIVAKWHLTGFKFDLQKKGRELWTSIQKMIVK